MLIFDEVISGFRLRFGGYYQEIGITPDLVTLGKIIGGGMPVGGILGGAETMDHLSPLGNVYQAGTLSGNPVALAAGIATLQTLKQTNPYPELADKVSRFTEYLAESGNDLGRAQTAGSIVWLYPDTAEFPRSADTISNTAMKNLTALYPILLDAGYYLPPSSYEVLFFSTAHTEEDIRGLAQAVGHGLKTIQPD